MYLTFWYSYIDESNFVATRSPPLFPAAIYLLAFAPTLLMMVAGWRALWRNRSPADLVGDSEPAYRLRMREWVVTSALLLNLLLVITWGLLHGGAWSFYQARLTFSAFFSIAILFGWGIEVAGRRNPLVGRLLHRSLLLLYSLFAIYYLVEVGVQAYKAF